MKRQRSKSSMFGSRKSTSKTRSSARNKSSASDGKTRRISVSEIEAKAKKKKSKKNKFLKKEMIRTIIMLVLIVAIILSCIGVGMYVAVSKEIKDMHIDNLSLNYSSIIYYNDELGNSHELEQLYEDGNRIWLEPDEIPDIMKEAVVSIEDERFYEHNGVDLKRTFGAFVGFVFEKLGGKRASYGGSTITQQVIKNITHEKERSSMRKIKEIMRAVALEKELSKDEILTMYLNIVFFANNCYGIEAAADMYFDKPASELTLTEACTIAGITQRPSYYDPLRNPENALSKRNVVLKKMNELGKITDEEYEEAVKTDLGLRGNHAQKKSKVYSYFVDQVINDVMNDLQAKKGYSETFARQQVYSGGLKIYTTMDYEIQAAMESVFENNQNFPSSAAAQKAQASMIIIEPTTGEIKGIIGGKGPKTNSRGLNRATQTYRQPGSALKPLAVYGPGIDTKKFTPATVLLDKAITIGDWSPSNAYSGYKGEILLRKAIEISSNTAAVRALQDLGIETSYKYLENNFHISSVVNDDKSLSPLALGGLTKGVSLEELAAAYGAFANQGEYMKPYTYTKVIDNTGKLLLENEPQGSKAVSREAAFIMTNLLTSVVKGASGTGRLASLPNMPVAGKTGTTNDNHDKWFVGYTPYYVGAAWFGFDTPSSISKAGVYGNISAKLWGLVMKKVHENLPREEFMVPSSLAKAYVCTATGKLAGEMCDGSAEYFIKGTRPIEYCDGVHPSDEELEPSPTPTDEITGDVIEIPEGEEAGGDVEEGPIESGVPTLPSQTTQAPQSTPQPTPDDDVTVIPE